MCVLMLGWWRSGSGSKPRTAGGNAPEAGGNEEQHIGSGARSGSPLKM